MSDLASDWPVYILVMAMISFFIFAIVKSKQEEKKNKEIPNQGKKNK